MKRIHLSYEKSILQCSNLHKLEYYTVNNGVKLYEKNLKNLKKKKTQPISNHCFYPSCAFFLYTENLTS